MDIYVVKPGDSIFSIAQAKGVPMSQIINDNRPTAPSRLVVGEALVIRYPERVYTVRPGDTVAGVARDAGLSVRQLYRNNPILEGRPDLYPGQTLVLSYQQEKGPEISVNGYAYPFINQSLLRRTLPFTTFLTPFTFGIERDGSLVDLDDSTLIAMAREAGTESLMHLSTLTEEGNFSNELAHLVLTDLNVQGVLIDNILETIQTRGYTGLDVDFEFVFDEDALAYAAFIRRLRERLTPFGYPVVVALAPKTSADQRGLLYDGHNYRALGAAADEALLMTYEWGYTYGPPLAVAPLPNVRRVVEYAITEIPPHKLWLGIPNYGYDWTLPFVQGESKATSISNQYAVSLARKYGVEIQFSDYAQAPWFRYFDENGKEHEVWFEDARSIRAKLALIPEYGLNGAGYWNLMRPFPQNWLVLDSLYQIRDPY